MKKVLYLGSVFVLAFALYFFTIGDFSETEEFNLNSMCPRYAYNSEWNVHPISREEESHTHSILNQKFKYKGHAHQSHIFFSEDDKYVLKLARQARYHVPRWTRYLLPPFLPYRTHKIRSREHKLNRDFKSYKLAFDRLQAETSLQFVHLNHTDDFHHAVTLLDDNGNEHVIDLHDYEFILQDMAVLVFPTLEGFMARGDTAGAQAAIDSLLELVYKRCKKGIHDSAPNFEKNFAFINNKAVQIDIGRFSAREPEKFPSIHPSFKDYLHAKFPELENYFEQRHQVYSKKYAEPRTSS